MGENFHVWSGGRTMKFKFKGQVEIERLEDGQFVVTRGDGFFISGHAVLVLDELKKWFTPADCEALNLVDPDRTERLCPPIINSPWKA